MLSPERAKMKKLFWCQGVGALRVLQNPELFDSLFPGYGEARADAGLWNRYFQELFDQTVYSPLLMKVSSAGSLAISASSAGSLDIFLRHGADILVFGLSDTFIPVSSGMLRDGLAAEPAVKGRSFKILQCGRGNLTPEGVEWYARALQGRDSKIPLILWGYSLVHTHRTPDYNAGRRDLRSLYRNWRSHNLIANADWRFPHPSWEIFLGEGLQRQRAAAGLETEKPLIPDGVAKDPRALRAYLENGAAGRYSIAHEPGDCDMSEASRQADRTIAELLKLSEKVLIFLPPTAPVDRRGRPACLMPNLTAMLRSKAGARVSVDTRDWDGYGLGYADYLYPARGRGGWTIDPLHANDGGAKKISYALARRAAGLLAP